MAQSEPTGAAGGQPPHRPTGSTAGDSTITVLPIETPGLGDRSYLVHDGEVALVVDPQRDVDRVLALAERAGVRITHVAETHIHNDYVSGGHALARTTAAAYLVNVEDPVRFDRVGVGDGDLVEVGTMTVRVLHTPGHTHTHLSYAVIHRGRPVAVFTGGSLLHGSTGRPDLLGPEHTDALVHAQWRSVRRLADELPDDAAVYPTHGFGSFCSASRSDGGASTLGQERRDNPALLRDEQAYVEELLAGLDAHPAYYAHMAPANLAGPAAPDLSPPAPVDSAQLRARIAAGEWVVDLRDSSAFAAGHLGGSLSFPLGGQFVTYLGWLLPWGTPVTLLGPTVEVVGQAQRELVRIGIDRPAGAAVGGPEVWAGGAVLTGFRRASFAELARALVDDERLAVLDVRRVRERARARIPGSLHIPIHELLGRLDEVPAGPIWVHCAGGYRAGVAAGLLQARGHEVISIEDGFDRALSRGLAVSVAGPDAVA
jgi:glyoxylase-like metal-dependent hydrolase (beta-lactamase superfamily II)/rhodanese-related sulfurtransferase